MMRFCGLEKGKKTPPRFAVTTIRAAPSTRRLNAGKWRRMFKLLGSRVRTAMSLDNRNDPKNEARTMDWTMTRLFPDQSINFIDAHRNKPDVWKKAKIIIKPNKLTKTSYLI